MRTTSVPAAVGATAAATDRPAPGANTVPVMAAELTDDQRQALRTRYRAERDKRLRPDGNEQYQEPSGRYANLMDDTYTDRKSVV